MKVNVLPLFSGPLWATVLELEDEIVKANLHAHFKTSADEDALITKQLPRLRILIDCGWTSAFSEEDLMVYKKNLCDIDLILLSHSTFHYLGAFPYIFKNYSMFNASSLASGDSIGSSASAEVCHPELPEHSRSDSPPASSKCNFPPIYCTEPVFKLGKTVLYDAITSYRLTRNFPYFDVDDVKRSFQSCTRLRFHQEIPFEKRFSSKNGEKKGFRVYLQAVAGGHSIGGCVWKISAYGRNIVFGTNYTLSPQWLISGFEIYKELSPSLFITDVYDRAPGEESWKVPAVRDMIKKVRSALQRNASVLIPVDINALLFELLLCFEEFWSSNPHTMGLYSIFFVSPVADTLMLTIKTSIEWMGKKIRHRFCDTRFNPFNSMKSIKLVHSMQEFEALSGGPFVAFATPLSLECGFSREILFEISKKPQNLILFPTPPHPGSLAFDLWQGKMNLSKQKAHPPPPLEISLSRYYRKTPSTEQLYSIYRTHLKEITSSQARKQDEEHLQAASAGAALDSHEDTLTTAGSQPVYTHTADTVNGNPFSLKAADRSAPLKTEVFRDKAEKTALSSNYTEENAENPSSSGLNSHTMRSLFNDSYASLEVKKPYAYADKIVDGKATNTEAGIVVDSYGKPLDEEEKILWAGSTGNPSNLLTAHPSPSPATEGKGFFHSPVTHWENTHTSQASSSRRRNLYRVFQEKKEEVDEKISGDSPPPASLELKSEHTLLSSHLASRKRSFNEVSFASKIDGTVSSSRSRRERSGKLLVSSVEAPSRAQLGDLEEPSGEAELEPTPAWELELREFLGDGIYINESKKVRLRVHCGLQVYLGLDGGTTEELLRTHLLQYLPKRLCLLPSSSPYTTSLLKSFIKQSSYPIYEVHTFPANFQPPASSSTLPHPSSSSLLTAPPSKTPPSLSFSPISIDVPSSQLTLLMDDMLWSDLKNAQRKLKHIFSVCEAGEDTGIGENYEGLANGTADGSFIIPPPDAFYNVCEGLSLEGKRMINFPPNTRQDEDEEDSYAFSASNCNFIGGIHGILSFNESTEESEGIKGEKGLGIASLGGKNDAEQGPSQASSLRGDFSDEGGFFGFSTSLSLDDSTVREFEASWVPTWPAAKLKLQFPHTRESDAVDQEKNNESNVALEAEVVADSSNKTTHTAFQDKISLQSTVQRIEGSACEADEENLPDSFMLSSASLGGVASTLQANFGNLVAFTPQGGALTVADSAAISRVISKDKVQWQLEGTLNPLYYLTRKVLASKFMPVDSGWN